MDEKKLKSYFKEEMKEFRQESARHMEVLSEDFQSKLRPIAEMQLEHSKKLDALFEMVVKNTEDIDIMKGMLRMKVDAREHEALERRVTLIEKKLRNA